jgi:hypothetical protein
LCCGRLGRGPKGGGERSVVIASGDAGYWFVRRGDGIAAVGAGCRSVGMVFDVFERDRSGLRRRRGRVGSGSRKGLFSSSVALHDCMIDETDDAERRC